MAKRQATKKTPFKKLPKGKGTSPLDRLRSVLSKQKASDLIQMIVELADDDPRAMRQVQQRFKVEDSMSVEELVDSTRAAISTATKVDSRRLNHNFDYDSAAYELIARNFKKLIELAQWESVMEMSLELLHKGSNQVECSDEGMMTEDIQACLFPVIKAVRKSGLKSADIFHWSSLMVATDRVGFICRDQALALQAAVLK